jgi:hypothetical protein
MNLEDITKLAASLPKREICAEDGKLYLVRYLLHGWSPDAPDADSAGNVYLHNILLPDQDERHVLHNHPWSWALSNVLHGWYVEERQRQPGSALYCRSVVPGQPNELKADTFHRITDVSPDCWSLVLTGPKTQSWGFDVPGRGFIPWRERLVERGITPGY